MNNLLTPEEAAQTVTYGDLDKVLQELGKTITDIAKQQDDDMCEVVHCIFDTIADVEYKRVRDARFLLNMLNQMNQSIDWYGVYNDWCSEYDKLNKGEKHEI